MKIYYNELESEKKILALYSFFGAIMKLYFSTQAKLYVSSSTSFEEHKNN